MRSRRWLPTALVALLLFPMIERLGAQSSPIYLPHNIQGTGATSPFPAGTAVIVSGIVTARKFDGFFIQTRPGMEDGNPNTSEGLFVSSDGTPGEAAVGHLVQVHGSVAEFVPESDLASPSRTELNLVTSVVDMGALVVPAPYTLTHADVSAAGALDQLERFEGMRVSVASLTAITGTGGYQNDDATWSSDGTFYAVLTGQARPFREPGVEVGYPVVPCQTGPCHIPIFDGNPERLRVDSAALENTAAVDLSTGAVMTGVVGPLDFDFRTYTLLPELTLNPVGGSAVTPAPVAAADRFTIASFHMAPGLDAIRMAKASQVIRTVLNNPDVLGVQEVEDFSVLQQLANRIDDDTAAGEVAPGYEPWLFGGTDGFAVGVLVKTAGGRVNVTEAAPVGDADMFERPPVMLRVLIQGPAPSPFPVTVIVSSLRSRAFISSDDETGAWARAWRRAQAEFLAAYIQNRQAPDATEQIVSIGDYNAFGFNDGYVDTVGTILGTPSPQDQVAAGAASPDLVSPNLRNLADFMAESERYSSLENGNAQVLEHAIVTANLVAHFAGVVHPRVNADFQESLRGETTPERGSDRDPLVAYFSFTPDTEAPVISFTPLQPVEATSAAGAIVTYAAPTAFDDIFGAVDVVCDHASGATYQLGDTTVTCTATDAVGNTASESFTVTVEDTTAPVLVVPANITAQATSSAGLVVNFTATATDAVSSPVVTCAPPSGTTFPVAITTVLCSATDAEGNSDSGSFTVTITDPPAPPTDTIPGHMYGAGTVGSGNAKAAFAFDVRESANQVDRGWIVVIVGHKYFAAPVSRATFTDSPGFKPGKHPYSGIDTVSFAGTGWWNGHQGYKFEAAATDQGESWPSRDTFSFVVRAPNGTVVASGTGTLRSGNIESTR